MWEIVGDSANRVPLPDRPTISSILYSASLPNVVTAVTKRGETLSTFEPLEP